MLASKHKLLQLFFLFFSKMAKKQKLERKTITKPKAKKAHKGEEPPAASSTTAPKNLSDGSNSILQNVILGLQAQIDAAREVFPTRVTRGNYQTLGEA
jgi:hypothetical protein